MDIHDLQAKIAVETDVNTSENVKHFERIKELIAELVDEMNAIQYGANVKSCEIVPKDRE